MGDACQNFTKHPVFGFAKCNNCGLSRKAHEGGSQTAAVIKDEVVEKKKEETEKKKEETEKKKEETEKKKEEQVVKKEEIVPAVKAKKPVVAVVEEEEEEIVSVCSHAEDASCVNDNVVAVQEEPKGVKEEIKTLEAKQMTTDVQAPSSVESTENNKEKERTLSESDLLPPPPPKIEKLEQKEEIEQIQEETTKPSQEEEEEEEEIQNVIEQEVKQQQQQQQTIVEEPTTIPSSPKAVPSSPKKPPEIVVAPPPAAPAAPHERSVSIEEMLPSPPPVKIAAEKQIVAEEEEAAIEQQQEQQEEEEHVKEQQYVSNTENAPNNNNNNNNNTNDDIDEDMNNAIHSVVGIGLVLIPNAHSDLQVSDLVPGGPASRCGSVHVGDILVAVDGESLGKKTLSEVNPRIRGVAGSSVQLTLSRGKQQYQVTLIREETRVVEGFLMKKGGSKGGRRNWSRRFFVLRDAQLYYFKTKTQCKACTTTRLCATCSQHAELKGTMTVQGSEAVSKEEAGHSNCFRCKGNERSILCQAATETEMNAWLKCLQCCVSTKK